MSMWRHTEIIFFFMELFEKPIKISPAHETIIVSGMDFEECF